MAPKARCRLDELPLLECQGLAADDARHVQPDHRPDGDENGRQTASDIDGQQDDEENEGQRIEDVDDPHHHAVDPAAQITGDRPIGDADQQADQGRRKPDHQRDARPRQSAGEQVTPVRIGAEIESGARIRRGIDAVPEHLVDGMRTDIGPEGRQQNDHGEHQRAADGQGIARQAPPEGVGRHRLAILGSRTP